MFHALLDQINYIPEIHDTAASHQELRQKIVDEGYHLFLKTGKFTFGEGTEDWKKLMSDPSQWGDEVALNLASNVLGVDIVIITAFRESAIDDKVHGLTITKSLEKPRYGPLYLFLFSESDFRSAHYQSIRPRSSVVQTYLENLRSLDNRISFITPSSPVVEEENRKDIPVVETKTKNEQKQTIVGVENRITALENTIARLENSINDLMKSFPKGE